MQIENGPKVDGGRVLYPHSLPGRCCSSAVAGEQSGASPVSRMEQP